jgi:ribosomal protein S27AE
MTQEKKCYVYPEDISAIRFSCGKCGSASIIPIDRVVKGGSYLIDISRNCPHCGAPSGVNSEAREFAEMADFCLLLSGLAKTVGGRNLKLSFQIECKDEP